MDASQLNLLREAWENQPKGRAFLQYADALWRENDPAGAIETLEKGLLQNPNVSPARVLLSELLIKQGADEMARPHLLKLFELEPENLKINRLLAEIYYRSGEPAASLKHYKIILIFEPSDRMAQQRITELNISQPEEISAADMAAEEISGSSAVSSTAVTAPPAGGPTGTLVNVNQVNHVNSPAPAQDAVSLPVTRPPAAPSEPVAEEPELEMPLTAPELAEFASPTAFQGEQALNPFDEPALEIPGHIPTPETAAALSDLTSALPPAAGRAGAPLRHLPEPASDDPQPAEEITTETLAEIYVAQGHLQKAIRIFERLLLKDPSDVRIRSRIEALQAESVYRVNAPQEPALRLPSQARQKKINSLQNWLSVIQKERNA